jgi:hypothetical protein
MLQGCQSGEIKALLEFGENLALSAQHRRDQSPGQSRVSLRSSISPYGNGETCGRSSPGVLLPEQDVHQYREASGRAQAFEPVGEPKPISRQASWRRRWARASPRPGGCSGGISSSVPHKGVSYEA